MRTTTNTTGLSLYIILTTSYATASTNKETSLGLCCITIAFP